MTAAVALLLALPLFGGQDALEITNARATHGYLGAKHPLVEGRLPGDIVYFSFDIKNLKLDDAGRVMYSMLVEILDVKGRPVFKLGPSNSVAQNTLGGNSMPCSAHLEIPSDMEPGSYVFRITVADRLAKTSKVFEHKGKVLAPDFGLVQVATYADRENKVPAAPIGVVGESVYVHFATVGFARDKKTQQPDVGVSLQVVDDKGKTTMVKPLTGEVNKGVPDDLKVIAMQFALTFNREGTFTIEVHAHDKLSGKKAKTTLPLKVLTLQ